LGKGTINEIDLVKESVRTLSIDQLLSLMPVKVLKLQQERNKTMTFKFEAT